MPHRQPLTPLDFEARAAERSLALFMADFRRSLLGGLIAAPLFALVAQHYLPPAQAWRWCALCLLLVLLQRTWLGWLRRLDLGDPKLHAQLRGVMLLDALAWGSMAWMLVGRHPVFDLWIGMFIAGVASINALSVVREPGLYRLQMLALGAVTTSGLWLFTAEGGERRVLICAFYLLLLVLLQAPLARELRRGMSLQLANADLSERLALALEEAERSALTDALTGLPNRRALDVQLGRLLAEAGRQPFALLVLDIDHFKAVNDRHGHATGDAVLQAFAQRVSPLLRPLDLCARAGGEEFVVLLPGSSRQAAAEVAERLRSAVAESPLATEPPLRITLSIGVTQYQAGDSADTVLDRADAAVYRAKREGRDRVVLG